MDENQTKSSKEAVNQAGGGNAPKKNETKKAKENEKQPLMSMLSGKCKELLGEFRKIIWPDKKTLTKHTVNTIITSVIVGVVIVAMDTLFSAGYSLFVKLLQ